MRFAGLRCALLGAGILAIAALPAAAQDRGPADPVAMARWARDLDTDDVARVADAYRRFNAAGPEAIPVLIDVVKKGSNVGASHACVILGRKRDSASAANPVIEDAIAGRDVGYLGNAARALWSLGARPEKSLPSLQAFARTGDVAGTALVWRVTGEEGRLREILEREVRSPRSWEREFAGEVLIEFGPIAGRDLAFRLAMPLAKDADPRVRGRALCVLTAVDPGAPESLAEYERALKEKEALLRYEGVRGLAARGLEKPGVLAAAARSGYFRGGRLERWELGALLSGSGRSPEELAALLTPLLASDDLATRVGAALLASALAKGTADVARALADGLGSAELQRTCLSALTVLGKPAATVVTEIAQLLKDADTATAMAAADLLLTIGKPGAAAAPAVALALEDPRPQLRLAAANLLLTVYGTASVPDLEERLKGLDPAKYPEAARVLRKVRGLPDDTPPVPKRGRPDRARIEELVKELREAPLRERHLILRRVASIGPDAAAALPSILEVIEATDSNWKGDALIALAAVAPTDPKTPEKIGPFLIGSNAKLKSAAVQALVSLGPHQPRAAVAYLLDSVERDPDLRLEAAMALARIGASSVDFIRARLGHSDPEARLWFVRSLGEIGPAAKDAIPDLEKAAADADARVKEAAAKALKKIRGN